MTYGPKPKAAMQRLEEMSAYVPFSGCRIFLGGQNGRGYGILRMSSPRRIELAHRAAYEAARGPIPQGMQVLHHCDVRSCTNPEHLFLGTHDDNMADMHKKGRHVHGERVHAAKLTSEQAAQIKHSQESNAALAERFAIQASTIRRIKRGERWGHLT